MLISKRCIDFSDYVYNIIGVCVSKMIKLYLIKYM